MPPPKKKYRKRKSCRSLGEQEIVRILKEYNIKFIREYSYITCINPKTGCKLRFDFFLPEFNLLIEYQGLHHYTLFRQSLRALKVHKTTVEHDAIKKKFVKDCNINFLEIHYKEFENIFKIIKETIEKLCL